MGKRHCCPCPCPLSFPPANVQLVSRQDRTPGSVLRGFSWQQHPRPFKSVLLGPPRRRASRCFKFETRLDTRPDRFTTSTDDTFLLLRSLCVLVALSSQRGRPSALSSEPSCPAVGEVTGGPKRASPCGSVQPPSCHAHPTLALSPSLWAFGSFLLLSSGAR